MGFRKLQLNLLSQSGELINCVSCFAGQVSVFRAPSYAALEVYQRALAGIPGPERISIFVDDQNYVPSEHCFVGFGEHREQAHESVVKSFLDIGLREDIVRSLCASYDLDLDSSTRWSELSKCEARRARLLLATRTSGQILILNDPFEPLANQWRERFAELVVNFARISKEIVVVTNLSYRPESWIDNQSVARIQVGEEIQRTIGFGGQAGKGNDLVAQIREMMKDESKVAQILGTTNAAPTAPGAPAAPAKIAADLLSQRGKAAAPPVAEHEPDTRPAYFGALVAMLDRWGFSSENLLGSPRVIAAKEILSTPLYSALIAGGVIVFGGVYLTSGSSEDQQRVAVHTTQPAADPEPQIQPPQDTPQDADPATLNPPAQEIEPSGGEDPEPRSALDEYPESIKNSILISFQGLARGDNDTVPKGKEAPPAPAQNEEAGELLNLLATASDTGEGLPDSPPPSASNHDPVPDQEQSAPPAYGSEEEKREAIRKRFLEAIERAQNMKRQQVTGE